MTIGAFIFYGGVAALILYAITMYNGLVRLKHAVSQAWSNIDVLLKQRHDELPKLIETCRQYMQYEKDVLDRVTRARGGVAAAREAGDVAAVGAAEMGLRAGLANLYAVSENYPELRANDRFQQLQARITQLEAQIADRREYYNDTVNANNVRIEQFPDVMVARLFAFSPRTLLKFEQSETKDVDVKALFSS
jgi:LemA protein